MRVDLTDQLSEEPKTRLDEDAAPNFDRLTGPSRFLINMLSRPTIIVVAIVVPLTAIAWLWLILTASDMQQMTGDASNMVMTPWLENLGTDIGRLAAMLTPTSLHVALNLPTLATMYFMWLIMAIAMMLPSAIPMLITYAEICQTAAEKNQLAVPVTMLAAGYCTIWAGFAGLATLLQVAIIIAVEQAARPNLPIGELVGGLILVVAGLYQFSSLKYACLVKCRNPFATLFAGWSTRPGGIYRLGLREGVYCLGCCWAMMLVAVGLGTMNLLWMGFLTLFTLLEKSGSGQALTRGFGVVLLIWGLFLVLNFANLILS